MKKLVCAALALLAGSFATRQANAQSSHYLYASAFTGLKDTSSVQWPAMDPHVEATSQLGVGGVDPSYYSNRVKVDSVVGFLSLSSGMTQMAGDTRIDPKSWHLGGRLEQGILKQGSTTKHVRATLDVTAASAGVDAVASVAFHAMIGVGGCKMHVNRTVSRTTSTALEPSLNCINANGRFAKAEGALLTVDVDDIGSGTYLEAQVDVTFNHTSPFVGTIDAVVLDADLRVAGVGGKLAFATPTFQSQAPPVDGGAADTDAGPPRP